MSWEVDDVRCGRPWQVVCKAERPAWEGCLSQEPAEIKGIDFRLCQHSSVGETLVLPRTKGQVPMQAITSCSLDREVSLYLGW